jgi:deoxycytidine triphosphate deaminase
VRKQAPVVTANLLQMMKNNTLSDARYEGYSSCPLITGYGKMVLAEFKYDNVRDSDPFISKFIGNLIMLESVTSHQMIPLSIKDYTADHPYDLVPGQFILAQTIEVFHMPEDIAGLFFLKSSRAREGYENLHAGYADPGWHGSALTLELKNARQLQPLPIYPGLKIGQMVFWRMSAKPALSYAVTGSYNNDKLVAASKQFLSGSQMPILDAA